ncbi:MAG: MBL fold metallo-hydrolase [Alphaproteobacteria bacterium]|jgi:ribonuclease J|nr:MBL fold metallo-hydrolase [Alphaproteobacteria bacterium]
MTSSKTSAAPAHAGAPADDALVFLPLGGTGEIGMNFYLYGVGGKWLIVDCGIAFGDETTPGIDVILPDPDFVENRREDVVGLVLTHAHEDHLGAIQYLWPRLGCPVYATPFTAAFLRLKLREVDFGNRVEIREVPLGGRIDLDPFDVEFVSMTHSIPEPNALAIRTRHGTVLHSGDWKLDPQPLIGGLADSDRLREIGEEGVLALVCDSTNVFEPGTSGSEADVRDGLTKVIAEQPNRVAVTCFATNVARIQSIAEAAYANGRHAALVGRSMWRIWEAAGKTGYLDPPEPFVSEHDAGFLPRDKVVLICTGSQGEPRAALSKLARDDHPQLVLEPDDTVVYSAREIPGNEKAIGRTQNQLAEMGVKVITPREAFVHVSGHPHRDELIEMYQWLRPQIAVPMHGERRHLEEHARLARACQVPTALVPEDGMMIRLAPGRAEVDGHVPAGRLALDGKQLIDLHGDTMRARHRMIWNGTAVATLVVDRNGKLKGAPQVSLMGLEEGDLLDEARELVSERIRDEVGRLSADRRVDDDQVREAARVAVRRAMKDFHGKRPTTEVHVVRL